MTINVDINEIWYQNYCFSFHIKNISPSNVIGFYIHSVVINPRIHFITNYLYEDAIDVAVFEHYRDHIIEFTYMNLNDFNNWLYNEDTNNLRLEIRNIITDLLHN
jgi:hypothetical protein